MKMFKSIGAGVLLISLLMVGCERKEENATQASDKPSTLPLNKDKEGFVDHVKWLDDIDTGFALAKEQNKPLIIMAEAHGCGWCRRMKQETLNNPRVLKKLDDFIMVKMFRENETDRARLPEFHHVPILFFYQSNGEYFDSLRGFFIADDFMEYLNELD